MVSSGEIFPKTFVQLSPVYHQPLFALLDQSRRVHRNHWGENEGVQLCRLLSIKTEVEEEVIKMLNKDKVLTA